MKLFAIAVACVACAEASTLIPLVTFDGSPGTTFTFKTLLDPVMGGKSTGSWSVNQTGKFGVMDGQVVDVPKLKAPGFITASGEGKFADVSAAIHGDLVLRVRTSTPGYTGYFASFNSGGVSTTYSCAGGGTLPFSRGCFKARFSVAKGGEFVDVRIPFNNFTDHWSPKTGEAITRCSQDKSVCPTEKHLRSIKRMWVWGEGADGHVHLEVQSISALVGSSKSFVADFAKAAEVAAETIARTDAIDRQQKDHRPPADQRLCQSAVQPNLRFNISSRTDPEVFVDVDPNESLAEAVCCDKRTLTVAEPQGLFEAPDINLFGAINKSKVTTFYDSVCGLPLFKAPVNRSFQDFFDDTNEHGWPSFRTGEVALQNVIVDAATGEVKSSCGTHLGSFMKDEKGDRWCIDLSCIAGNPLELGPPVDIA